MAVLRSKRPMPASRPRTPLACSRLGEYEAALQAYEQALAIHPGLPEVRTTIEWLKTMIKQQR